MFMDKEGVNWVLIESDFMVFDGCWFVWLLVYWVFWFGWWVVYLEMKLVK